MYGFSVSSLNKGHFFFLKTIDDPNIMGDYILARKLLRDGSVPLTLSGVLG